MRSRLATQNFYSGDCIQPIFATGVAKNLHQRLPSHSPSIHRQWFLFANITVEDDAHWQFQLASLSPFVLSSCIQYVVVVVIVAAIS